MNKARNVLGAAAALVWLNASVPGCASDANREAGEPADSTETARKLPDLCSRNRDAVTDAFCASERPTLTSLADLQTALHTATDPSAVADIGVTRTVATLLGHSTALDGNLVSPINPRAIIAGAGTYTLMAFQRGVQRVEITSRALDGSKFDFYLVTFRQACNTQPGGCRPADLYTPRIERDWLDVEIHDDEDLKNTATDCRQCHQRGRAQPALLMRELDAPWTHYFASHAEAGGVPGPTGGDLALDYIRAKGFEPYAGIAADSILNTTGYALEFIVDRPQPLLFNAQLIRDELWRRDADGELSAPQRSATWDRSFEAFKRGEQLALPYFHTRATDPIKQAQLGEQYLRYTRGELPAEAVPDLANIFPDDPLVRAEIGLQVTPDASPAEALIQACSSCHNDVLDQTITRARFNVAVARLTAAELRTAIERLRRAADSEGVMPPKAARQLDERARAALIAYLESADFPDADATVLDRAARLGMAGAAQR